MIKYIHKKIKYIQYLLICYIKSNTINVIYIKFVCTLPHISGTNLSQILICKLMLNYKLIHLN